MLNAVHPKGHSDEDNFIRYLLKYGSAIVAVLAALALRDGLAFVVGYSQPTFVIFCPALFLVAFLAGRGPCLLASIASVLAIVYFIDLPGHHFAYITHGELEGCAFLLVTGIIISFFPELYRRATKRGTAESDSVLGAVQSGFLQLFHASPISMSIVSATSSVCYEVNQAHVDMFGYSREETVAHTARALNIWVVPEERQRFLDLLTRNGRVTGFETSIRRKNGEIRTALLSAEPVRFGDDELLWMMHTDITQRKQVEESLRASERKFSQTFADNPAAVALSRLADGTILEVNNTWIRSTGYGREEAVGKTAWTKALWSKMENASEFVRTLKQNGSIHDWEQTLYKKSGESFVAQLAARIIESDGEEQILTTFIDITARRDAELAIRTLMNVIPASVLLLDSNGVIVACNEHMASRLGKRPEELIGALSFEHLSPEVHSGRRDHFEKCVATGMAVHFTDVHQGISFENYMNPIRDSNGRISKVAVFALDITERIQSETQLRQQAALLDIASDAILAKDLESRIVYWNKGAERIFGWTSEEVKGKTTFEVLYPKPYVAEGLEARKLTLEYGEWKGDLHQLCRDGKEIIVEAHWTLIRDDEGNPTGILSVKTDVTARRATELQLLRTQRLESLGTLAGGIAHDLNNVLAPILLGAESLSMSGAVRPQSAKILAIMRTSAERGANIVKQILTFARGIEGEFGEIQLKHVLREVEEVVRETFPKSITVKADFARDLWPIIGDATQIHQVLLNLCVNARDAMPTGGLLTLSAWNAELDEAYARMNPEARPIHYAVLTVEDTGTGIAPDISEKIFDPFFTTKELGKGTGLGLSTTRSIVKDHGGFINAYSEINEGSSFKVYIPSIAEKEDFPDQAAKSDLPRGAGEMILVADDEEVFREITRHILESNGYRVVLATDGPEAVARFAENRNDLRVVITDMMMRMLNGPATIRAIRSIDSRVRVIAASGLVFDEYEKEMAQLGVQAFLTKPFTAEKLLRTLHEILSIDSGAEGGT